jgi:uncharacterized protein
MEAGSGKHPLRLHIFSPARRTERMTEQLRTILADSSARERNILKNVYAWMTAGLALTGVVAYTVSQSPGLLRTIFGTPGLFFILLIGELGLVLYLSARITRMSSRSAVFAFTGYALLNGVTLSSIFIVYTGFEVSQAFFSAAAAFGGMSFYGMTTKKDLSGIGSYMIMGLWGIIIASLINVFFASPGVYYLISYVGLAVFMGLTAWDTQVIKGWNSSYGRSMSEEEYIKISIMGALKLYLDFINMFLFLLRIFGRRR